VIEILVNLVVGYAAALASQLACRRFFLRHWRSSLDFSIRTAEAEAAVSRVTPMYNLKLFSQLTSGCVVGLS
jgi:hypothetical protein